MIKLIAKLQTRLNEDKGATAVEYGLLVTLVSLAIILAATALGDGLNAMFAAAAAAVTP